MNKKEDPCNVLLFKELPICCFVARPWFIHESAQIRQFLPKFILLSKLWTHIFLYLQVLYPIIQNIQRSYEPFLPNDARECLVS